MKKVLLSVAVVAALGLASCGGPSMCDCAEDPSTEECKKMAEDWQKEYDEASEEEQKKMLDEAAEEAKECEPAEGEGDAEGEGEGDAE